MNQGSSILCEVCERPRLATRPPVASLSSNPGSLSDTGAKVLICVALFFFTYILHLSVMTCVWESERATREMRKIKLHRGSVC